MGHDLESEAAADNEDFALVPKALGAKHADGADFYLAATKVWLDGPLDHTWLVDLTLR